MNINKYLEYYSVSEEGEVRRIKASNNKMAGNAKVGRVLKHDKGTHGHERVTLCLNGKTERFLVHRLVALIYIPNPHHYPIVNHIDGNPSNNHKDNLEWCDYSHNLQHAYDVIKRDRQFGEARTWAKLKDADIPTIRDMYRAGIHPKVIGEKFGVNYTTARDAAIGKHYSHIKY